MPPGAKIQSAALAYIFSGYLSMIQALLTDYFACPKFEFGLFNWNKKLWTSLFHESLTVTKLFTESFSNPSLWSSGIGSRL